MANLYTYPDAYLARFCDEDREARAVDEVARLAGVAGVTFSDDWTEQLAVVQCYILAAMENQADPEDLFSAKLKNYRARFSDLLPQAISAAKASEGLTSNVGIWTVPLERA